MTPASGATGWTSSSRLKLARTARALLFVGGLGLTVWLVRAAGVDHVLGVLRATRGWLLVVALLELVLVATDVLAARALLGSTAHRVSANTWIRATALAYASTILLPAGRAAGEAARAATLARDLGVARATGACARLQACALLGNAVISIAIASSMGAQGPDRLALAVAVGANAIVCSLLAVAVMLLLRNGRVTEWLRKRFARFARFTEGHSPAQHVPLVGASTTVATGLTVVGRIVQTVQYAIVLVAVGGAATPSNALTAQGIHLVGAAVGDIIPGQIGATEGAYRAFAGTLGLSADPARALSIALAMRLAQLGLAVACLLVATLVRPPSKAVREAGG